VGEVAGHSVAGIVAAVLVVVWIFVGAVSGFAAWWQAVLYSVTASVTFVMVFVIQHAQQRQTSGTQRKLDELIRSSAPADNALIAVEEAADEHLQALTHLNLADRTRAAPGDPD
jgi:low affinity Fe/Cu permease